MVMTSYFEDQTNITYGERSTLRHQLPYKVVIRWDAFAYEWCKQHLCSSDWCSYHNEKDNDKVVLSYQETFYFRYQEDLVAFTLIWLS